MSLAATLNMTYLDDVAAQLGPDSNDTDPVNEMIQEHAVGKFLKQHGYRYIHIGNWFAPTEDRAHRGREPGAHVPDRFRGAARQHDPGPDHE